MTPSRGGTRGDTQGGICSGQAEPAPRVFEGAKPFARPRAQSGFSPGHKELLPESPPDISGCPVQRVWFPGVTPLPRKPLRPSGSSPASQPPGPPRRAINHSEPPVSPALPPAERHPSSRARCRLPPAPREGTPPSPGMLRGTPAEPALLIRVPHASPVPQREPQPSATSRQQLVAGTREQLGSERSVLGSRSRESPSPHTCPALPASRGTLVSPCCPPVPAAQGEEQPSLSLHASLGKQTPIKGFGDYSRARSSSSGAGEHEKTAQREDFCLQALVGSITLGAAALLCPRVTQRGDWHPAAKFGFAELHRAPTWHLPCHGDIPASPTPRSRAASL